MVGGISFGILCPHHFVHYFRVFIPRCFIGLIGLSEGACDVQPFACIDGLWSDFIGCTMLNHESAGRNVL